MPASKAGKAASTVRKGRAKNAISGARGTAQDFAQDQAQNLAQNLARDPADTLPPDPAQNPPHAPAAAAATLPAGSAAWLDQVFCEDALQGLARIPDASVDLILTDPPYNLGKDYGNTSDQQAVADYLRWTESWIDAALPKLKPNGSLYIFLTWRFAPEIFVMLKQRMTMINEIIWDRRVPSMGGSVRSFTSVHDTIGLFVLRKDYYFDLDAVRIPYDAETKKLRSRSIFVGAKWLEIGYNPKDLWSVSRLHREHPERADHPTQKPLEIIERMLKASCPPGGVVLDLFMGSGTTAVAAKRCGRHFVGFELNPDYCAVIAQRLLALEQPHLLGNFKPVIKRPRKNAAPAPDEVKSANADEGKQRPAGKARRGHLQKQIQVQVQVQVQDNVPDAEPVMGDLFDNLNAIESN